MMFVQEVLSIYTYDKFTAKLHYVSPWLNSSEYSQVALDVSGQRIRYAYTNDTNQLADETVANATDNYYARTTHSFAQNKTSYECIHSSQSFDDSFVQLVPDLTNFTLQGETYIHNQLVQHYRYNDYYEAEDNNKNKNYTSLFETQYDFYCKKNENNTCTPLKWKTVARSNFDSHTDIYDIEYDEFSFGVTDADFEMQMNDASTYNAQCADLGVAANTPVRHGFLGFQYHDKSKLSKIVQENIAKIEKIRAKKGLTFQVGINQFIDKSYDEIKRTRMGRISNQEIADRYEENTDIYYLNTPVKEELPRNWDLRYENGGIIAGAQDQLACGSCWANSAAGAIESSINAVIRSTTGAEPLVQVSPQAIVDCYWVYSKDDAATKIGSESEQSTGSFYGGSNGCEGGSNTQALKDLVGSSQFWSLGNYRYFGQNDYCKNDTLDDIQGYKITNFHLVPRHNVDELKRALMHTAVSVGISVPESLLYYTSGIYNDPECSPRYWQIGHAVLAVGWVETEYGQAWIIRNSWSNLWGQDGYIYIQIQDNLCAITDEASWVEVEKI